MFMSTRYKKRPEWNWRQRSIFNANDSLAKLAESLTVEFSCSKLITPKYKKFRSQKLGFDQKTRLNNCIWRAWHIQYRLNKKARFLQFAAPFSDETQHSTSQAVILDGKYWKKRLDAVSRDFKKWRRRLYKEKLLESDPTKREELADSDSDSEEEDLDDEDLKQAGGTSPERYSCAFKGKHISQPLDSYDTMSAISAFPDTLFSSLDWQKLGSGQDMGNRTSRESSGIVQPTLDQLNPCFDELMENFDFIFTEWGANGYLISNEGNDQSATSDILLDSSDYSSGVRTAQLIKDQFMPVVTLSNNSGMHPVGLVTPNPYADNGESAILSEANVNSHRRRVSVDPGGVPYIDSRQAHSQPHGEHFHNSGMAPARRHSSVANIHDVIYPQHHRGPSIGNAASKAGLCSHGESWANVGRQQQLAEYTSLPPQLQAPSLTAHLQASFASRPRHDVQSSVSVPSSKSDAVTGKRAAVGPLQKDATSSKPKRSRIRLSASSSSATDVQQSLSSEAAFQQILSASVQSAFQNGSMIILSQAPVMHVPRTVTPILPKQPQQSVISAPKHSSVCEKPGKGPTMKVNPQPPGNNDAVKARLYMPRVSSESTTVTHTQSLAKQMASDVNSTSYPIIASVQTLVPSLPAEVLAAPSCSLTANCAVSSSRTSLNPILSTLSPNGGFLSTSLNSALPVATVAGTPISSVGTASVISPTAINALSQPLLSMNDQQLLTLAGLLQSSQPRQTTESTLLYLGLLQQQLNLLIKQQQEQQQLQIRAHMQLQEQARRLLEDQRQQMQAPTNSGLLSPAASFNASPLSISTDMPITRSIGFEGADKNVSNAATISSQSCSKTFSGLIEPLDQIEHTRTDATPEPLHAYFGLPSKPSHSSSRSHAYSFAEQSVLNVDKNSNCLYLQQQHQPIPQQPCIAIANTVSHSNSSQANVACSQAPKSHIPSYAPVFSTDDRQSLVRALQSMEEGALGKFIQRDVGGTAKDLSGHANVESKPVTVICSKELSNLSGIGNMDDSRPPTTLDSAMALVSLREAVGRRPGGTASIESLCSSPSWGAQSKDGVEEASATCSTLNTSAKLPDATWSFQEHRSISGTSVACMMSVSGSSKEAPSEAHRRQSHLSAEQKRRGAIKNAFLELMQIIPGYGGDCSKQAKLSNAAVLEKAADYVHFLNNESAVADQKLAELKREIEQAEKSISLYQHQLPASGAAQQHQSSDTIKQYFFTYCKDMIRRDHRFWIFSIMIRPLFDSFNSFVSTSTMDDFLASVLRWLEQHCTMPILRSVVINSLTKLSTSTAILTDPEYVQVQAYDALQKKDPTDLG